MTTKPCDGLRGTCSDYPACVCGRASRAADVAKRNEGVVVPAAGPLSVDERVWMREYELSLNRRAKVEDELLEMARGKRQLPDKDKCRELAQRLGVPENWRTR